MVSPAQSVFLFIGNDAYSKEEALRKFGDSFLDSSARSLDFKVFRGSQSNATEIIENVSTIPFLAPKRLVVIKEFEKLSSDDRARIVEHTKKPLKTASLIIDSNEDSILKDFGRVPQHISVKTFGEPSGSDLTAWINRFFSQKGKKIKPEAIEFLKETRSGNLSELSGELEKLVLFVGMRDTVNSQDIEELVGRNLVASAFDLTNAIEANEVEEALKVVSDLLRSGKRHFEIVGLLAWHVKRLLKAKAMQLKGCTDAYIANSLRINQKYFGKFFKQVKSLKMETIRSQMRILLEADLDIKRSRLEPALALECAVIRLCLGGL